MSWMSEQPSVVLFSFYEFPPLIDSLAADPEETKNIAGKEFSASFRSLLMMHVHVLRAYWTLVVRGLQLKRFLTSLFAHARELPTGMVSGPALFRYVAGAERASWYSHQTMGRVHAAAINLPVFICES